MSLGPVMLDVVGTVLTADDVRRLQHPLVGGVILFARNFENGEQLTALTASIHALRQPPLLIAVDHEGGRVQRFRAGFTQIPPMRAFGKIWDKDRKKAQMLAEDAGWILAAELRAHGVDFSFTPILDMDYGDSLVIGDRAFHLDPRAINELAFHLMQGLQTARGHIPTNTSALHTQVITKNHPIKTQPFAQDFLQPLSREASRLVIHLSVNHMRRHNGRQTFINHLSKRLHIVLCNLIKRAVIHRNTHM